MYKDRAAEIINEQRSWSGVMLLNGLSVRHSCTSLRGQQLTSLFHNECDTAKGGDYKGKRDSSETNKKKTLS